MVQSKNRQTGFICNFYTDTENNVKNDLETAIREGFRGIGEERGVAHNFGNLQKVSDAELEGAKIFKKRFGKSRNRNETLQLIMNLGLAKDEPQASEVLQYMVDNDVPCHQRYLIAQDWGRFTLVPNEDSSIYRLNPYRLTLGDFFMAWKASTSIYDL